jgi:hypothetical protein
MRPFRTNCTERVRAPEKRLLGVGGFDDANDVGFVDGDKGDVLGDPNLGLVLR